MINVCLADNYPVVHYGVKTFFKEHPEIKVVSNVGSFRMVSAALRNRGIDVLVIDLELEGLKSIYDLQLLTKNFPDTKILIFTGLNENIYAPNAIKAGVYGYVQKTSKLETLGNYIIEVDQGNVMMTEKVKRKLDLIDNQKNGDLLYRKISNREIEVLRYLCEGLKNHEISKFIGLNEKTVSTYKLRLFQKLNVTNLIDLVKKAKTLEIV